MKLQDAAMIVSFLRGAYTNAPKQTDAERDSMIAAYFLILCEFSFEDALRGAREAALESPKFMPTAPEIRAKCVKTYNAVGVDSLWREIIETREKMIHIVMQEKPYCDYSQAETIARHAERGQFPEPFDALASAEASARRRVKELEAQALAEYDTIEAANAAPGLAHAFNVRSINRPQMGTDKRKSIL